VDATAALAGEQQLHPATRLIAAVAPGSRVRSGDEVEVVVDTERMHFFDPVTGVAIRG
jgi:multiple sugar transport system ATP-binding protein